MAQSRAESTRDTYNYRSSPDDGAKSGRKY